MKRMICLLLVAVLSAPALASDPPITWLDDFLGITINPKYAISLAGTGGVKLAPGAGGILALYATGGARGVARVRLGEEPGNSFHNALNFSARKNLVYKARVFLNRNTDIQATVGLTGLNDPENVLALIYDHPAAPEGWYFQGIQKNNNLTVPVGFIHEPGAYFWVQIETYLNEYGQREARVFINNETTPRAILTDEYIPDGLVAEFQVWNRPLESGGYSQTTLYADYLSIVQDR